MKVIAISCQKGGIGKTTTAAVLTQAAAYRGEKALAIDLDASANLSFALAADTSGRGSFDLLEGAEAGDLIQHKAGYDVIPANWGLSTITSGKGSARRLQRALEPIKGKYDLVIIDTPPTAGILQYNALQAATDLIIPLQADTFNLQAFYQMADTARQIQSSNPGLSITGIVFTIFKISNNARKMREIIIERAAAAGIPYLGTIRAAVAVQEAATFQQSLFEYAPKSNPAQDYMALYDTIIEQGRE